jgi:cytochrome c biogenesis protein CcdA
MPRSSTVCVTGLALLMCAVALPAATSKLVVHFFGSPTCGECLEIKTALLEPIAKMHADSIDLRVHDIESDSGFALLTTMEDLYKVGTKSPQELYLPDTFLTGYADIMAQGKRLIERSLANPSSWGTSPMQPHVRADSVDVSQTIQQRFSQYAFVNIIVAGLADGVNPCAIATMIFLISFLATQKRKRIEVLVIGLTFTATVFVTYLLLGVGLFKAFTALKGYVILSKIVKWIAVAAAGGVGLFCFRDAIVYARTGKAKDITIQLPKAVKMSIHRAISSNIGKTGLVLGTVVTGFLVTLLEAVCTGQIYLPTIILMTRQDELKLAGWLWLVFYNILFVLPLLVIMILTYFGLKWDQLSKVTQKHLPILKVLLGIVLVGLAAFLAMSL